MPIAFQPEEANRQHMNLSQQFVSQADQTRLYNKDQMHAFWRASWLKPKVSVSDEQRDHLLPENRDVDHRLDKGTPSRVANTQERYVGFGIGGAGNIRRFDSLSCVYT